MFNHKISAASIQVLAVFLGFGLGLLAPPATALDCRYGAEYHGPAKLRSISSRNFAAVKLDFSRTVSADLAAELVETLDEEFALLNNQTANVSLYAYDLGYWSATSSAEGRSWSTGLKNLVTATIIGQLIEEKQLLPDDTVDRWFPELDNAKFITIEQLLSHMSGLASDIVALTSASQDNSIEDPRFLFCPGTNRHYSDAGYVLLAQIAEALDQASFEDIVSSRIAVPLNLKTFKATSQQPLFGSKADMLKFLAGLLSGDLVSDNTLDDALKNLVPVNDSNMAYGRGLAVHLLSGSEPPSMWLGHIASMTNEGSELLIYDTQQQTYLAITLKAAAIEPEQLENTAKSLLQALNQYRNHRVKHSNLPTTD